MCRCWLALNGYHMNIFVFVAFVEDVLLQPYKTFTSNLFCKTNQLSVYCFLFDKLLFLVYKFSLFYDRDLTSSTGQYKLTLKCVKEHQMLLSRS